MSYPVGCRIYPQINDLECIRGGGQWELPIRYFFELLVGRIGVPLVWLGILTSMILLVLHVRTIEIKLRQYAGHGGNVGLNDGGLSRSNSTAPQPPPPSTELIRTRKSTTQALLYIGAFFIVFIWGFIIAGVLSPAPLTTDRNRKIYFTLALCVKFFQPMQGFFNSIVFLRNKFDKLTQDGECLAFVGRMLSRFRIPSWWPSSLWWLPPSQASSSSGGQGGRQARISSTSPSAVAEGSSFTYMGVVFQSIRRHAIGIGGNERGRSSNDRDGSNGDAGDDNKSSNSNDNAIVSAPVSVSPPQQLLLSSQHRRRIVRGNGVVDEEEDPRRRFLTSDARQRRHESIQDMISLHEDHHQSTSFFGWTPNDVPS